MSTSLSSVGTAVSTDAMVGDTDWSASPAPEPVGVDVAAMVGTVTGVDAAAMEC